MIELVLKGATAPGYSIPVGDRPIRIGRGPTCDLVLADPAVSGQHALIYVEAGRVWVQDIGSSNGTFVNGKRIRGNTLVAPGDTIALGPTTELVVAGEVDADLPMAFRPLSIEIGATGERMGLQGDRFVIGDEPGVHLRVPGAPQTGVLVVHANGEVWLGMGEEDRPLELNEPFVVGGASFRVVGAIDPAGPTAGSSIEERYELRAWLGTAQEKPLALLSDPSTGATCRFDAGNRAIFLYLLARRHAEDARGGVSDGERGWAGDPELLSGLWGRRGDMNRLYVLLHRVRADLKAAGLDPWCLERRRHGLRARVARALVDPPGRVL